MGQPITVVEKPSTNGVVRFEINRSLTGMGHERYTPDAEVLGDRPPDRLAKALFEHSSRIEKIHINSNVITVDLEKGATPDGLKEVIENLFIYYRPGVDPTVVIG